MTAVLSVIAVLAFVQKLWTPLNIPETSPQTTISPWEYIYCEFDFDSETRTTSAKMADLYTKWALTPIQKKDDSLPPTVYSIFR